MESHLEIFRIMDAVPLPNTTAALPAGCAICGKEENSRLCSACKAISYCSEDHQRAHRKKHRFMCNAVKKERLKSQRFSPTFLTDPGDFSPSQQAVTAHYIGEDYDNIPTQLPMQSTMPILLQRIHTVDSVRAQIRHYETFTRKLIGPCVFFEACILPLLPRVHEDQRMYDSIKSLIIFQTLGNPIRGADVLEPMDFYLEHGNKNVEVVLSLALLKAKLLLDMTRVHTATEVLSRKLPREIIDFVLPHIPQSPTLRGRSTKMNAGEITSEISKLRGQFDFLYTDVSKLNPYFWSKIASHVLGDSIVEKPASMEELTNNTLGDAKSMFIRHVHAWCETPGAIALIQEKCRSGKKGSHK